MRASSDGAVIQVSTSSGVVKILCEARNEYRRRRKADDRLIGIEIGESLRRRGIRRNQIQLVLHIAEAEIGPGKLQIGK
ncbi:hypothetical protein V1280_003264 [Bradyrhizobium sp. AZCC 2230]|jgi:hypothetical protein